jgi:hypothetical protein
MVAAIGTSKEEHNKTVNGACGWTAFKRCFAAKLPIT